MPGFLRSLREAPVLSYGFRPFFLGGTLWALIAMVLWIGALSGAWQLAAGYGPLAWHVHEFLFGYVGAIVAGFLLTAIPNWTGRLPVSGLKLLALFLLWCAGRAAMLATGVIGVGPAVLIEGIFLPVLALAVIREIVAGQNWRNLKMAALILLLALANIGFHAETMLDGVASYAERGGIAVVLVMIMLVGGRIVPSFTHNWLTRNGAARMPSPFNRFDVAAIAVAIAALAAWIVAPENAATGVALLAGALTQGLRLSRWAGLSTWREPLVFVLHVGIAFVPLGFFLVGAAVLWPAIVSTTRAVHIWTAGGMTLMTLAVMTRATRGHTGRALTAGTITTLAYASVVVGAASRFLATMLPDATLPLLELSGAAWIAAFAIFVALYGPMLITRRRA